MRILRTGLALSGWLLLVAAAWAQAPSIELRDPDGKPRNVNEFIGHGKWTVVTVWAHDCRICEQEIHEMISFHEANRDKNAIVLGVSIDGFDRVKEARAFIKRNRLPFVNLIAEPKQAVMQQFGAGRFVGTPTFYIYNPQGTITGLNVGPVTRAELEAFLAAPDPAADSKP